jgi:phosphatidylserine decarboxylase
MPVLVVMTSLCLFFLVVRFFRVPDRVINKVENGILSPADGTIVAIEEIFEDEYFKNKRLKISVFMSITNVHVNYFPIDGEVIYVCYHPGKHLVARYPKSSVYNEHQSVVVSKNEHETVLFRQIAGLIARRIAQQVKTGDIAVQGHEMGIIKFGSRVDVFLPLDCEPSVKIGDKVWAQKSVLAYF